jgi:hypothetical protein
LGTRQRSENIGAGDAEGVNRDTLTKGKLRVLRVPNSKEREQSTIRLSFGC